MSLASKATLGLAVVASSAIIGYVHYKQANDRIKLHEGVIRDVEQQKRRRNENTYQLQKQIDITKHLVDMGHDKKPAEETSAKPKPAQQQQQRAQDIQTQNAGTQLEQINDQPPAPQQHHKEQQHPPTRENKNEQTAVPLRSADVPIYKSVGVGQSGNTTSTSSSSESDVAQVNRQVQLPMSKKEQPPDKK